MRGVFAVVVCAVVGCSSSDSTGTSHAALTLAGNPTNVSASVPPILAPSVPLTSSVVVSTSPTCQTSVVAYDVSATQEDDGDRQTFWTTSCTDAASGGTLTAPTQVTQATVGKPAEWVLTADMVYLGQPQLISLATPAPLGPQTATSWVAMVLLAGPDPSETDTPSITAASDIAVLLSVDGGITFGAPHLLTAFGGNVQPVSQVSSDFAERWLSATGSFLDLQDGEIDPLSQSIFATWNRAQTDEQFVNGVNYVFDPINPSNPNPVFFNSSPNVVRPRIRQAVITAGVTPDWHAFVFLLGAAQANDEVAFDCTADDVGASIPQMWQGFMSTDFGTSWNPYGPIAPEPNWPRCVGGNRASIAFVGDNFWQNSARAAIAYDWANEQIVYAIPRAQADGAPIPGTFISLEGWPVTNGPGGPAIVEGASPEVMGPTGAGNSGQTQDQWQPALAIDSAGFRFLSWVDSGGSMAIEDLGYPQPAWWNGQIMPLGPITSTQTLFPSGAIHAHPLNNAGFPVPLDLGSFHGAAAFNDSAHTFVVSVTDGETAPGFYADGVFGIFTVQSTP